MKKDVAPLFLARESYRYRRLTDAARVLPFLGLLLFFLPLMWPAPATAAGLVYLFSVWFFLILCAAWLAARLGRGAQGGAGGSTPGADAGAGAGAEKAAGADTDAGGGMASGPGRHEEGG